MDWSRLWSVKNVADLNDVIVNGEFGDLVRINEALHEKEDRLHSRYDISQEGLRKTGAHRRPQLIGKDVLCQQADGYRGTWHTFPCHIHRHIS